MERFADRGARGLVWFSLKREKRLYAESKEEKLEQRV